MSRNDELAERLLAECTVIAATLRRYQNRILQFPGSDLTDEEYYELGQMATKYQENRKLLWAYDRGEDILIAKLRMR